MSGGGEGGMEIEKHNDEMLSMTNLPNMANFMVGDLVSFHGWAGQPYHSKWSFRTEYQPLVEVVSIEIEPRGFVWMSCDGRTETDRGAMYSKWDDLDRIAHLDGIDPPTGQALKTVLLGMHPIRDGEKLQAQVIRW